MSRRNLHMQRCAQPFGETFRAIDASVLSAHAAKRYRKIRMSLSAILFYGESDKRLYRPEETLYLICVLLEEVTDG